MDYGTDFAWVAEMNDICPRILLETLEYRSKQNLGIGKVDFYDVTILIVLFTMMMIIIIIVMMMMMMIIMRVWHKNKNQARIQCYIEQTTRIVQLNIKYN